MPSFSLVLSSEKTKPSRVKSVEKSELDFVQILISFAPDQIGDWKNASPSRGVVLSGHWAVPDHPDNPFITLLCVARR